ncbi:MAG: hypothetical protein HOV80_18205 [Polyangiaceae bacterium]|nr:hypothetical protein [Polyangiaceae bacterium]
MTELPPSSPLPTRDELLAFLDALAEPVGPWVFAGYGGEIARLRHETMAADDDTFAGVFAADSRVDAMVHEWASRVDPRLTLERLVEIAVAPPSGADPSQRPADRWTDALCDLLVAVALRAPTEARALLRQYVEHATAGPVVTDALADLDDELLG